jgi:D-3-phosphoglycerate dehydrogenase / 2-oxoglutarate reductase
VYTADMQRPTVLIVEAFNPEALKRLEQVADIRVASGYDEPILLREAADVSAIIVRARGRITRQVMEASAGLKVVARHGVGVDNIDLEAAAQIGIPVVHTPEANHQAVAEHALAMILALSTRLVEGDRAVREGDWDSRHRLVGFEVRERRLGVIGFGRIGQRLARLANGIGMVTVYHDPERPKDDVAVPSRYVSPGELLATSDVVSLHTPLTRHTHHMIGEPELRSMKSTAVLINTARGSLIDHAALETALEDRWIRGAGLDVFDPEPLEPECPLLQLPNVVLTPHMAAHTAEALRGMSNVVDDVIGVLRGDPPRHPVLVSAEASQ